MIGTLITVSVISDGIRTFAGHATTQRDEMTVFFSVTLKAFPNNILTVN